MSQMIDAPEPFLLRDAEAGLDADEAAVWALEEAYWRYALAQDAAGYTALWDDRVVGWPLNEAPVGKAQIDDWLKIAHAHPGRQFTVELECKAVRSFGDVVAVHYLVRANWLDRESDTLVGEWIPVKFTHTWQRRGESWQIIAGMAARMDGKGV